MKVNAPIDISFVTDQNIERHFKGVAVEAQEAPGLIVDANTQQIVVRNVIENVETNIEDGESVILAGHRCVFNRLTEEFVVPASWAVSFTEYRVIN